MQFGRPYESFGLCAPRYIITSRTEDSVLQALKFNEMIIRLRFEGWTGHKSFWT
jgi:hypothetical protein